MVIILVHLLNRITHLATQLFFIDYKSLVDLPILFIQVFNINDFTGDM